MGRRPRSLLDVVRPDLSNSVRQHQESQKRQHDRHAKTQQFCIGDSVFVRNFSLWTRILHCSTVRSSYRPTTRRPHPPSTFASAVWLDATSVRSDFRRVWVQWRCVWRFDFATHSCYHCACSRTSAQKVLQTSQTARQVSSLRKGECGNLWLPRVVRLLHRHTLFPTGMNYQMLTRTFCFIVAC